MYYSIVVETLRKMYLDKKLEIAKVKSLLDKGVITKDEYKYILEKEG